MHFLLLVINYFYYKYNIIMSTNIYLLYGIIFFYILSLIYNIYTYGFAGYFQRRYERRQARWDKVDSAIGLK